MIPTARLGDLHVCPIPGHGTSPIVSASPDTQINYLGAARVGDVCGCGAAITVGFPSILIDNLPLAHLGSPTSHGGTITTGSPDTFGGFQFAGASTRAVVDFAKLGAVWKDGSVNESLMAQLLADPNLEQRAFQAGALLQPSASPEKTLSPELIAVAGSQHDNSSGNKMMFIGQAVRELAVFRQREPSLVRTLVIFTPAYTAVMLGFARDSAKAYDAGVVEVATAQELIDYLNQGKDRATSPIQHLALFSHGVPHKVAFGYELPGGHRLSLDVLNYEKISPQAFSTSAKLESFACRTGMGNRSEYRIEDGIQFFPQTNESLAQLMANHLGISVRAYVRRSEYKNTWGRVDERQFGKLCRASKGRMPDENWCKKWEALAGERKDIHDEFNFTYQIMGAVNPVESGDTPIGAPGGHFEFLPK
ncbi:hypothetical protein HNP46_003259 [Pseudomonas nitritireducens]|uniref:Zn-binding Pro-Ala-Ala-Arg (PAAR) domain-containing protein, incolved in TypeVI secretion n=1 Tax=Pseudomonas nitroreducens TaxID=46680 RepID=A0A7W7P2E8_PSENT|nr:PAAR domain-containing protein [Pseudomonas nitritireducens]MBB4864395.1 hypothetical protein [Pseudomonas nitritireducens]